MIIAAGCAFYALLALFPGITAMVSVYGVVADPAAVERQLEAVQQTMPQAAYEIIAGQAKAVASGGATALTWGAALALVLALYSASAGVKTLFTALNVAYEQPETRSFVRFQATAIVFTICAILAILVGLAVIIGVPAVLAFLPLGPAGEWIVRLTSWTLLFIGVAFGIALLYRFGPSRAPARWRWLTPGSLLATILWLVASLAFSFYAANFGAYNETYGALGGVIVLLMWLWLSALALLLGAELNAELELQTVKDTTTGPSRPMGRRGAFVADHTADDRRRQEEEGERAAQSASRTGDTSASVSGGRKA
jgi:membrane protein